MTRYLLVLPVVLLGACVALYAWAAYDLKPFKDWEGMYN